MRVSFFLLLCASLVWAQGETGTPEPAPEKKLQRGFEDGKFVDEYFGLVYEAKELKEGFGFGDATQLFSGKCAGGVEVEVMVMEAPQEITAEFLHGRLKEGWVKDGKTRTDMEHGAEPRPWSLFVEESLAGFKRHHGWAVYTRGVQGFLVHAQVQEKTDTSGEAIKAALAGLKLDEKSDSFLLAHLVAKQDPMGSMQPTDIKALLGAASGYLSDRFKNPPRALQVIAIAEKQYDSLGVDEQWSLMQSKGLALLTMRKLEEALPVWKKTVELSKKTSRAADWESNSRYNLACAHSLMGNLDAAFEELKASLSMGSDQQKSGLREWAPQDPDLEPMRKDPRWKEMFPG